VYAQHSKEGVSFLLFSFRQGGMGGEGSVTGLDWAGLCD
jgi:hypothetical protein